MLTIGYNIDTEVRRWSFPDGPLGCARDGLCLVHPQDACVCLMSIATTHLYHNVVSRCRSLSVAVGRCRSLRCFVLIAHA